MGGPVRLTNRRGLWFRFFMVQPVNRSSFLNFGQNLVRNLWVPLWLMWDVFIPNTLSMAKSITLALLASTSTRLGWIISNSLVNHAPCSISYDELYQFGESTKNPWWLARLQQCYHYACIPQLLAARWEGCGLNGIQPPYNHHHDNRLQWGTACFMFIKFVKEFYIVVCMLVVYIKTYFRSILKLYIWFPFFQP
jgi:hypothetical protein